MGTYEELVPGELLVVRLSGKTGRWAHNKQLKVSFNGNTLCHYKMATREYKYTNEEISHV
jgi:hypothetical protein